MTEYGRCRKSQLVAMYIPSLRLGAFNREGLLNGETAQNFTATTVETKPTWPHSNSTVFKRQTKIFVLQPCLVVKR
jgi:hypothetical protein